MTYFFKIALLFVICLSFSCERQSNLDSTVQKPLKTAADSIFIKYYKDARTLRIEEKHLEALEVNQKALEVAIEAKNKKNELKSILLMGHLEYRLTNLNKALDHFFTILESESPIANKYRASALIGAAEVHQKLGDYDKALFYQLENLKIQETDDDSLGVARAYYNLGQLHFYQDKYDKALSFYQQSMEISKKINSQSAIYFCLGAMGSTHERLGDLEASLNFNKEALSLARKMDTKSSIAYSLQNIGTNYKELKDYDRALVFLNQAVELYQSTGDKWGEIGTYQYLGELFIEMNDYNRAINILSQGLQLAKGVHSKTRMEGLYKNLAIAYEAVENYQLSTEYLRNYSTLKDSIINESKLVQMKEVEAAYEISKRENQISSLKKEKALANARNYFAFTALLACLALVGMFIYWVWQQRKTNTLLEQKNKQIDHQNNQLTQYNEELKQFAYVASHDLKEPLRTINAFTTLLHRQHHAHFDEESNEFMTFIIAATKRMQNLLNDLLTYSKIDRQQVPEEILDTREIINITLANLQRRIKENDAVIKISQCSMPRIRATSSQMVQLFQNIIGNALKFKGKNPPIITISCESTPDFHQFSIRDNGIGIPKEKYQQIFEMFNRVHSRQDFDGTGIGLATCKKIVERHGGKIWVESTEGEGSAFFFTISQDNIRSIIKDSEQKPTIGQLYSAP